MQARRAVTPQRALAEDFREFAGGDPTQTATSMHRIDPAIIKRDFAAAGLTFESESPAFASSADDHSKEVFDKAIRHKTDQVMYKFRKT